MKSINLSKSIYKIVIVFLLFSLITGLAIIPALATDKKYTGETIYVITQRHTSTDALVSTLPEFEKQTGIKVDMEILPYPELNRKVLIEISQGTGAYDIVTSFQHSNAVLAPYLEDLTKYNNNPELTKIDFEDFLSGWFISGYYRDKLIGIPFYGETKIIIYNKEIFEEAGLDPEIGPKTWDDVIRMAKQIKEKTGLPGFVISGHREQAMEMWADIAYAYGWEYVKDGKIQFNSPEAIKATEIYKELELNYAPIGVMNVGWEEIRMLMAQGQVAMCLTASVISSTLENPEKSEVVGKLGYVGAPIGTNSDPNRNSDTHLYSISSFSKHKEAAWEFIAWATSKKAQLEQAMIGERADVTRKSVMEDKNYIKKYGYGNGDYLKAIIQGIEQAKGGFWGEDKIKNIWELYDTMSIALQEVLGGKKSVEEALNDAQKKADEVAVFIK